MKRFTKRCISLAAVLVFAITCIAQSGFHVQAADEGHPVTVYTNSEYSGKSQSFGVGEFDCEELKTGVGNDQISSIRIADGYRVTLYKNSNFQGSTKILTADERNFKNISFNDTVSSIRVEQIDHIARDYASEAGFPVTMYSESSFCGISQSFNEGSYNTADIAVAGGVGNDTINSLRVTSGYQVVLYSDSDFAGSTEIITTSTRDISLYDNVSSFTITRLEDHLPVILYTDADWWGTSKELNVGEYDVDVINTSIGNDTLSSVRVLPGYKVTLYKDAGFNGSKVELTQDIYNLKSIDFNDVVSSVKIEAVSPLDDTCIEISAFDDATMVSLLTEFAPRIWMAEGERYWASSIEFGREYLTRYFDQSLGKYALKTTEPLSSATAKQAFFSGDQENARCYAFWTDKAYNNIDLSYWQYCPYNFGKVVVGQEFGDHVGDWEHVTVRLSKFEYNGVTYVKPTMVALPYHSSINVYTWAEISKVEGTNHPIAYCAKESHGMWKDAGNHVYQNIVIAKLTDECSAGTAMDCWTILNTYEFSADTLTGRGLGATPWDTHFDADYDNPLSNSVYRWGNEGQGSVFGQSILSNGPHGPEGHNTLFNSEILR